MTEQKTADMGVGSIQASSIQRIGMVLGACRRAPPWVDELTLGFPFGNTTDPARLSRSHR